MCTGDPQGEVSALDADAGEGTHRRLIAGQIAAELVDDATSDIADLDGFALVEGGGMDQAVDLVRGERSHGRRGTGDLEQAPADRQALLVTRPDGDDASDELLEGGGVPFLREREHRGFWIGSDRGPDAG